MGRIVRVNTTLSLLRQPTRLPTPPHRLLSQLVLACWLCNLILPILSLKLARCIGTDPGRCYELASEFAAGIQFVSLKCPDSLLPVFPQLLVKWRGDEVEGGLCAEAAPGEGISPRIFRSRWSLLKRSSLMKP